MPQDGFTVRLVALELDRALAGGRINRINQPEREELSLVIYTGKRTVKLTVNVNASDCGIYFCENDRENPPVAFGFCMLLRKYLQGAEILGVSTEGVERIVRIRFRCVSDFSDCERELVVEIMGKYSNALLLENGIVLGAVKTTSLDDSYKRAILAGVKYVPPAPQDKADPCDFSALSAALSAAEGDRARVLFTRVAGLAPVTAEEIAAGYRGGDFAEYVYRYINSDEISPCVVYRDGKPADFFARAVKGGVPYPTLSEAQSAFYTARRAAKRMAGMRNRLLSAVNAALKKQEKRLAGELGKRAECAGAEDDRIAGELVTANLYRLGRGMRSCELDDYYAGGTRKIALDPLLSPSENAQAYFKRYRKRKRALEITERQEKETRAELGYLRSLLAAVGCAESEEDLKCAEEELFAAGLLKAPDPKAKKPKEQKELPYRTYACEGFTVLAGRNNLQNDRLLRASAPDDVWLHAQRYHSCHVIVKAEGRAVPPSVLQFAANVCAKFSDGGGDRVAVDHCPVRRVKKPAGSKAGFVTYSDFSTLLGDPKEVR